MLSVIWSSQGEWYSTDASLIVEVVPLIASRAIAGAPEWCAGLADHHGRLVPIVDADRMLGRVPPSPTLATRILLLRVACHGESRTVGLRVEAVRGIERIDFGDAGGHSGLRNPEMPHLGAVVSHAGDTVQRIDFARWLEGERGDLLFGEAAYGQAAPGDLAREVESSSGADEPA